MISTENTNMVVKEDLEKAYEQFCHTGKTTLLCRVSDVDVMSEERYRSMDDIRKALVDVSKRHTTPHYSMALELVEKDGQWSYYLTKGV